MQIVVLLLFCLVCTGCFAGQPAPKPILLSPTGVTVNGTVLGGLTPPEVKQTLTELAQIYNISPQDAAFDAQGEIVGEKAGKILDVQATADAVLTAAQNNQVEPVFQQITPKLTQAMLRSAKIIGSYETPLLDDNPDRLQNIKLTASLLNNTVLAQGQEFSFNALTGEPTEERGFRNAAILQNGKKVKGIGGGMCQVSTTLYNAVLEAGLQVTERHAHSLPVSYVPEGRDATTYTNKDFRFINSKRQSIILRLFVDGKAVKADVMIFHK